MEFELEIIRFIQGMRSPFMDTLVHGLTQLGDQTFFIAVGLVLYWFFNKKIAFKLVFVFIFSAVTNDLLKGIFARPRPYTIDPSLNVTMSTTVGHSFPSGHAQNAAVVSTVLHRTYGRKTKWLNWVLLAIIIIVPFTRVYLGQHYPTDVIVGVIVGIVIAFAMSKVVDLMGDKKHKFGLLLMIPLLIIVFLVSLLGLPYDEVKNMYVAVGGLFGFMFGYLIDKFKIQYNQKATGINILWRALIGGTGVLILYVGLSFLFDLISVDNVYFDFVRYALIGLFGTAGAMYLFKTLKV